MDAEFVCSFCFQVNSIYVDPSGGASQQYYEDCQICCQPNWLSISWADDWDEYTVESLPS